MKIKLVIFDLDGTLAATVKDMAPAAEHVMQKYGAYPVDAELARRYIGPGAPTLMTRLYKHYGIENGELDADVAAFRSEYMQNCMTYTDWLPGALESLKAFKEAGLHMAMATLKPGSATRRIIHEMKMDDYITYVLSADDMLRPKPDPWCIEQCAAHFGVSPRECAMVGDSPPDVGAARSAGALAIAVRGGYCDPGEIDESGADIILDSLEGLPQIILERI